MNENALAMARQHAPCYLYSREVLTAQAEALRGAFPGFDILFSVKANPFPPVVDKKTSHGTTYVIVENCLNGFQKPAIAAMLRSAAEGPLAPQEPLFTIPISPNPKI